MSSVHGFQFMDSTVGLLVTTINGERFAGPNFRGFEEDRKSFSVNILHEHLFNNYQYNISAPGQ